MKVGFTGTRFGMKPAQYAAAMEVFRKLAVTEFHHGDCIGADNEAASSMRFFSHAPVRVVCHPPVDDKDRARNVHWDELRPTKTHFARNRDIVDESDVLVATPFEMTEQPKGGTWYTINYARKKGKPVWICWPDGIVSGPDGGAA